MASWASNAVWLAGRMRLSWRSLSVIVLIAPVVGIVLYGTLLLLAAPLLWIKAAPRPVDAIVVLGGDGPRRAAKGAQLYHEGLAPRVFVTGDGDCLHIALTMINEGVPAPVISVECKSGSTWENALFSAPLLAQAHVRSGIIVTSWFHTRRALLSFESASPGIAWLPVATPPDATPVELATSRDGWAILLEYLKTAGYALKYNLNPLKAIVPEQDSPRGGQPASRAPIMSHGTW